MVVLLGGPVLARGDEPPPTRPDSALWDAARFPRAGAYTRALERARLALDRRPSSPASRAEARQAVDAALRQHPARPEAHLLLGEIHLAASTRASAQAAVQAFRKVRALDAAYRTRHVQHRLAVALALAGDFPAAARAFVAVIRVGDPAALGAILAGNAAEALAAAGQLRQAIAMYRQALTSDGAHVAARLGLSVALHREGRRSEALAMVREALRQDPELKALSSPHAVFFPATTRHYQLALVAEARGALPEARAAWQAFLAAEPEGPWTIPARAALARLAPASPPPRPVSPTGGARPAPGR